MRDVVARLLTLGGLLTPLLGSLLYEASQRSLSSWFWDVVWGCTIITVMLWAFSWAVSLAGIEAKSLNSDRKLPEDPSHPN